MELTYIADEANPDVLDRYTPDRLAHDTRERDLNFCIFFVGMTRRCKRLPGGSGAGKSLVRAMVLILEGAAPVRTADKIDHERTARVLEGLEIVIRGLLNPR